MSFKLIMEFMNEIKSDESLPYFIKEIMHFFISNYRITLAKLYYI